MSKSILVIDTPDACINCPCHFSDFDRFWCGANEKDICGEDIEKCKPIWCPLIKEDKEKLNDFIDKILKDGE